MSKEQIDKIMSNVEELKATHTQALKDSDTLLQGKVANLGNEITKALEANQALQMKQKADEDRLEKLEAAFNRPGAEGATKQDAALLLEHKNKFTAWIKGEINLKEVELFDRKSMSTNVNPDGGYLVRPELLNTMVTRIFETSPIRQLASVMTISSKSAEMPIDDDEGTAAWVGEGAQVNTDTTTPQVGVLTISAHKLEAEPRITQELIDDSYMDVEAWLAGKLADKFGRTENTAFVSGNGVAKPKGFLSYTAGTSTYVRDTIEQVNSGTSGAVTADGAIELQNSLFEAYQARAVWVMKRIVYTDYLQLKDSNNQYLFGLDFLKNGQLQPTLLGKRVVFADDMPVVASGSLSVAYGDFGAGYQVIDRVGLTIQRDPFTAKGFIKFYTTKRVGGAVINYQAIKLQKLS